MTQPTKTSHAWMREHMNDSYVQRAKRDGWRSRAVFKLMEIDEKDRLVLPGEIIVDLGAAPGSWSQYIAQRVLGNKKNSYHDPHTNQAAEAGQNNGQVQIFAIDLLPMDAIAGVNFIQGDFHEDKILAKLTAQLAGRAIGLVISDMMPNMSGIAMIDQAKSFALAELALEFAQKNLKQDGAFLVKVFQGSGFQEYFSLMRRSFVSVTTRKPKASRDRSAEVFLLGRTLRS